MASGTGLNPKPAKPICVHGKLSENSSVIVPFRNPTEHTVVVDVSLKEKSLHSGKVKIVSFGCFTCTSSIN